MSIRASVNLAAFFVLISIYVQAIAQPPPSNKYSSIVKEPSVKRELIDRYGSNPIAVQHAYGLLMARGLVVQTYELKDRTLRVRILARLADVLWDYEPVLARDLFRAALDMAVTIDKEGAQTTEEARGNFFTSRQGITFITPASNLRLEVLKLIAQHDYTFGEMLLLHFNAANDEGGRLELATELLKQRNVERAKLLVSRALYHVTSQSIIFLRMLRQYDARSADEFYARLLTLAMHDQSADATTVSLLYSYLFTSQNQWSDVVPAAKPPAKLSNAFFNVAAHILLRSLPPPDQDHTAEGRSRTYFSITRLLPLFQQYAPDYVPALIARLATLAPDSLEPYRNNDDGTLTVGSISEDTGRDDLSSILTRLSNSTSDRERDLIYVEAIRAAAIKGDGRIRELADKIENFDLRKSARSFADFAALRNALEQRDVEEGIQIISAGNLLPIQRVWAYSEAARLVKRYDPDRAVQLLDEAASEARGINYGDPERVRALACVASQFFALDHARTQELMVDVVKASNAVADFSGDDCKLTAQLRAGNVFAMVTFDVPALNLIGLFELLVEDDFEGAAIMANSLRGDAPRAIAYLAITLHLLKQPRVRKAI